MGTVLTARCNKKMEGLFKPRRIAYFLGRGCNLACRHCCVMGGPDLFQEKHQNQNSLEIFFKEVKRHNLETVLFTGGEPTLYLVQMQNVIEGCRKISIKQFGMITNGHFLIHSDGSDILDRLPAITFIHISCGRLYGDIIGVCEIKEFSQRCQERHVRLSLKIPILMPEDILLYDDYLKLDLPIAFNKVMASGRAQENQMYFSVNRFDESLLDQKCRQESITYYPETGFSVCCGNLYKVKRHQAIHATIEEHLSSPFYRRISEKTFGQFAKEVGVESKELTAFHSHPCHLCEHLFNQFEEMF